MKLLHIDSSILGGNSVSRQLTAEAVQAWSAVHPNTQVDYLDLAVDTPPHLSAQALGFRTGQEAATEEERNQNAISERLVSQFLAADVIVIGSPFYNFGINTQLRSWIDRILQPGRTFRYTATGPEGLAAGKKVIVVATRGGVYSTSEAGRANEHQEGYLKTIFGFAGVTDVQFARAEGLAMGEAPRAAAIAQAQQDIAHIVAAAPAVAPEKATA
ncbi:MAG: FMN-dependent NADH-azoreductase [Comamonas sp.]